jgi:hypothetical protein
MSLTSALMCVKHTQNRSKLHFCSEKVMSDSSSKILLCLFKFARTPQHDQSQIVALLARMIVHNVIDMRKPLAPLDSTNTHYDSRFATLFAPSL